MPYTVIGGGTKTGGAQICIARPLTLEWVMKDFIFELYHGKSLSVWSW